MFPLCDRKGCSHKLEANTLVYRVKFMSSLMNSASVKRSKINHLPMLKGIYKEQLYSPEGLQLRRLYGLYECSLASNRGLVVF